MFVGVSGVFENYGTEKLASLVGLVRAVVLDTAHLLIFYGCGLQGTVIVCNLVMMMNYCGYFCVFLHIGFT